MTAQPSDGPTESHPDSQSPTCTLAPIAAEGQDALPSDTAEQIAEVKLRRVRLAWRNALHDVATLEADDLFHSTLATPLPPGATLTNATLWFRFTDTAEPNRAHIRPPNGVKIDHPGTARRIASWLTKNHYLHSQAASVAEFLSIITLALLAGTAPLVDSDSDPDDDTRHPTFRLIESRWP